MIIPWCSSMISMLELKHCFHDILAALIKWAVMEANLWIRIGNVFSSLNSMEGALSKREWFYKFFFAFCSGGPDPNARSFNPGKMLRQQAVVSQSVLLPESLIWTYVIQMTSALRHIHLAGLACRTLDPTKILIINKTRLLLNCCGIFDVLTFDPTSSNPMAAMAHYQQEDLIALGKIVLGKLCLLRSGSWQSLFFWNISLVVIFL